MKGTTLVLALGFALLGSINMVRAEASKDPSQMLVTGVRLEQVVAPALPGDKGVRTGTRIELGILGERLAPKDKLLGVIVMPKSQQSAFGDPDYCTVTVFYRYCHVISHNPYIEQCYWMPTHVEGKWNEKGKCCEVTVDGQKICAKGAIYKQF